MFPLSKLFLGACPSLGCLIALAAPLGALGDQALEGALARAEAQYRERLDTTETTLKRLYREHLRELEQKATEARAYEQAADYRREALRVEQALEASATEPLKLTLFPIEATRSPGLGFENDPSPRLTGWQREATATWQLPRIPCGGYEVKVFHRGNPSPVLLVLEARDYFVSGRLAPDPNPNEDGETVESSLGHLRIVEEAPALTLSLDADSSGDSLAILQIVLVSHAPFS